MQSRSNVYEVFDASCAVVVVVVVEQESENQSCIAG